MNSDVQLDPAEQFFSGAIDRIRRITIVLGLISTVVVWATYGTAIGVGFLIGCAISYVNFHWLERAIETLIRTGTISVSDIEKESTRSFVMLGPPFEYRYLLVSEGCHGATDRSTQRRVKRLPGRYSLAQPGSCTLLFELGEFSRKLVV